MARDCRTTGTDLRVHQSLDIPYQVRHWRILLIQTLSFNEPACLEHFVIPHTIFTIFKVLHLLGEFQVFIFVDVPHTWKNYEDMPCPSHE
jgi:hypothetical protein